MALNWERGVPDEEGYWLRVTAGHTIQLKLVYRENEIPRLKGELVIFWGWSGEQSLQVISSSEMQHKLSHFYWYGPIPRPTEEAMQ